MDNTVNPDSKVTPAPALAPAATTPASVVPTVGHLAPVGTLWRGRHTSNLAKTLRITGITADGQQLRAEDVASGRLSTLTPITLGSKYERIEEAFIPHAPTPAPEPAITPTLTVEKGEPSGEGLQDEGEYPGDHEPLPTTAASMIIVGGWSVYTQPTNEPTVLDVDLGARAGLAEPRTIRRVIADLIESEEIEAVVDSSNCGTTGPAVLDEARAYESTVTYDIGNSASRTTKAYHLNAIAVALVLMRMRTAQAKEIRKAIAHAFVLLRQGLLEDAARVAGSSPPVPPAVASGVVDADRAFALIDDLEEAGRYDRDTALLQRVDLLRRTSGIDLAKVPNINIELAPRMAPLPAPLAQLVADAAQLEPGGKLVTTKPVDVRGHLTARKIGRLVTPRLTDRIVAKVARALGLHGDTNHGKWTTLTNNGDHEIGSGWYYAPSAQEILRPVLQEIATRSLTKTRAVGWTQLVAEVCAKHKAKNDEADAVEHRQTELPLAGNDGKAA